MKRLTHEQALELLRKKAKKATVEEFLAMPAEQAWLALGCYTTPSWGNFNQIPYNPLYGPKRYY